MTKSTNIVNKLTVVVGAGDDYACDLSNSSNYYLLIDARRDVVGELQRRYGQEPRVNVKRGLISDTCGYVKFHYYSLPELSSILKPDAFNQFLPGLTIKGSESYSAESLDDLINEEVDAKLIDLVLDVPGQELAMLTALANDTLLKLDGLTVIVQCDTLYENGNTASELDEWLSRQNFEKDEETQEAFGLVKQHWSIDKTALRILQLERERDEAVILASNSSKDLVQIKRERDEVVAQASSSIKQLESLQKRQEQQEQRHKKVDKDLTKLSSQLALLTALLDNTRHNKRRTNEKHSYSETHPLLVEGEQLWLEGEWHKLVALESKTNKVRKQEVKTELACLLVSGFLQTGEQSSAQSWFEKALEWDLDEQRLADLLIGGINNTIGRLYALQGDMKKANQYFQLSITTRHVKQTTDANNVRAVKEAINLGLIDEAIDITDELLGPVSFHQRNTQTAIQRMQAEIRSAQKTLEVVDTALIENTTDFTRLWQVVEKCFEQTDVQEAIDQQLLEKPWTNEEKFHLCIAIAEKMSTHQDRLQAISWINQARLFLKTEKLKNTTQKYRELSELAARFGQPDLAIDLSVESSFLSVSLNDAQKAKLKATYTKLRATHAKKQQHGHDLLIDYLKANPHQHENSKKKPVLIEIGTTRENAPGQGSTLQLAELAATQGIQFISVDMDPHNSHWAKFNMELMKLPGETVSQKGEDFLAQYPSTIEYIFLDAYDFDHGNHSELRQQRYQKYLGGNIDELQCHQMHLDCAKTLLEKLSPTGIICVDDTWQDDEGHWTAKGTLAVPFLLDNGFKIIEARNRAILMNRKSNA